jgi:Ca-activated chloride channel family protein
MTRILAIWLVTVAAASPFGGKAHRKVEEGNRLYAEGQLDDALRAYTEAQVSAPDAPELLYDIGNVLYRNDDLISAEEAYAKALASAPPAWAGAAAYNHGNALFAQERFEDAAASYRRALEFDPGDVDAKHNLEIALRRVQQEQQQQQDQQNQESGEDDQDDPQSRQQDDPQQDPQQDRQQQQPGEDDEPNPSDRPQPEDGRDPTKPGNQHEPTSMTPAPGVRAPEARDRASGRRMLRSRSAGRNRRARLPRRIPNPIFARKRTADTSGQPGARDRSA